MSLKSVQTIIFSLTKLLVSVSFVDGGRAVYCLWDPDEHARRAHRNRKSKQSIK